LQNEVPQDEVLQAEKLLPDELQHLLRSAFFVLLPAADLLRSGAHLLRTGPKLLRTVGSGGGPCAGRCSGTGAQRLT
jgi:hypothetical protein